MQEEFEISDIDREEADYVIELIKKISKQEESAILCTSDSSNPNCFSITYANKAFLNLFNVEHFLVVGKDFDFLFKDIDLNYESLQYHEYAKLIKAVKNFKFCSAIIDIKGLLPRNFDYQESFNINFNPGKIISDKKFATIIFQKVAKEQNDYYASQIENSGFVSNLERMLRNERLLRSISYLVVSDIEIEEIAQKIAKILCEHFKVDRCLIHDLEDDSSTNFVVENCSKSMKPIISQSIKKNHQKDVVSQEYQDLIKYLHFQNELYKKLWLRNNEYGEKKQNISIFVEDVIFDHNFAPIQDICQKFGIVSQISVISKINNQVNNGIYIHQNERRKWLVDEIEMIEMIADQFAIAVDRSRSIDKIMITNHQLTEKTHQLKDALRKEKELRKTQNEFVATVSHEFKTPLQIIDSTRELLMRKLKNTAIFDENIEKDFEKIKNGVSRMTGLIDSTINLAKLDSDPNQIQPNKKYFDIRSLIIDIVDRSGNIANNRNLRVNIDINDLPNSFFADQGLLDHVFTNIISNAMKYSNENSEISIIGKSNQAEILITIIDSGIGIPSSDLEDVGKKFFRAGNSLGVSGTGIGLYLSRNFVNLHNGSIKITSKEGVGTTAIITLPVDKTISPKNFKNLLNLSNIN